MTEQSKTSPPANQPKKTLRRGIRHFRDVPTDELQQWLDEEGKLDCTVTEKTDGMVFAIGWDYERQCVFTQTAHSPRTHDPLEYRQRAIDRFGDSANLSISNIFIEAHKVLTSNGALCDWLRQCKGYLSGEMFLHTAGERRADQIKFVGTWYDIDRIPAKATFVLHTKTNLLLPPTPKQWTTRFLKIDDDEIVCPDLPAIGGLSVVDAEQKLKQWAAQAPGKWGREKEGFVFHRDGHQPLKIMNDSFYTNKRVF